MKVSTVKELWKQYLKLAGQKEENMYPVQLSETRKAFYGCAGMMIKVLRDEIGSIDSEAKAIAELEKITDEIEMFWTLEVESFNKQKNG